MRSGLLGLIAATALVIAGMGSALAAKQPPAPLTDVKVPPAAPAAEPNQPPPYDEQLLRLSEILGAMHYLRPLCGSDEGSLWRDEMQALLQSEQPDGERKARFVDRFNRGYDGFKAVYRVCTPAATEAIDRYMEEGARIARDVSARYGKEH